MKTTLVFSAALLAWCSALKAAPSSDWRLIDLGTLGGSGTLAYAINDWGQVVGMSQLPGDGDSHAFFYANGAMLDLAPLNSGDLRSAEIGLNNDGQIVSGELDKDEIYVPAMLDLHSGHTALLGSLGGVTFYGFSGVAAAINDAGMAVGYSYIDGQDRHAFAYRHGTLIDLGSFGGYSAAMAVNSAGVVAGFASDAFNGFSRACVWANHSLLDISFGRESEAYGINDHGEVVGFALGVGADHAFLFDHGGVRDLGILKRGRNSYAYGINDHGEIVGQADAFFSLNYYTNLATHQVTITTNYHEHAFLYAGGKMADLNSLLPPNCVWELNSAVGINDFGEILVWASADGGIHFHSFIMADVRRFGHHALPPGKDRSRDHVPPRATGPGHGHGQPAHGPRLTPPSRRGWEHFRDNNSVEAVR